MTRVLTDNDVRYRSRAFAAELATTAIPHGQAAAVLKWTRLYRSPTNGEVERFDRILLKSWAYARPYASETERCAALPD